MWRPLGALVCQDKEDGTYCLCKYVNPPPAIPCLHKECNESGQCTHCNVQLCTAGLELITAEMCGLSE